MSRVCTNYGVLPSCTWEQEAVFIPTNRTVACKSVRKRKQKKTMIMQKKKKKNHTSATDAACQTTVSQQTDGKMGNLTPEMTRMSAKLDDV